MDSLYDYIWDVTILEYLTCILLINRLQSGYVIQFDNFYVDFDLAYRTCLIYNLSLVKLSLCPQTFITNVERATKDKLR